jgi:hypothetical protein
MSKTSIRVTKKRVDAAEIRNLTLDEIEFVTGGAIARAPTIRVPTVSIH